MYSHFWCSLQHLMCWFIRFVFSYEEGDMYGRPPMPPPAEMWGYRPPFDMPFDPRWGRGMPPPFMPPPPDFRIPVNSVVVYFLSQYICVLFEHRAFDSNRNLWFEKRCIFPTLCL